MAIGTQGAILDTMKSINWSPDKNRKLIDERGISFEEIFLKTIVPSRKATKQYLGEKNEKN